MSDTRKTVVHVDNSMFVTGAFRALISTCDNMPGYRHVLVFPRSSSIVAEVPQQYVVYELPFVELGRNARRILTYVPMLVLNGIRLRRILRQEGAAVLHVNDLYNLAGYVARLGLRMPIIVHARMRQTSFPWWVYQAWVWLHLMLATRIVAVSDAVKRDWGGDPRIRIIYDRSFPPERHPPYVFGHPVAGEPFRFVCLANYIPGKGQDDVLRALSRAKRLSHTAFTVDFVGGASTAKSRDYLAALQNLAHELGLASVVRFLGPTADAEETLKSYHAVLHFSHSESFGMVCFEACYYGVPVISTACGGPEEYIEDGASGLLVPIADPAAGGAAIARLIDDPTLAPALAKVAHQTVRHKFGSFPLSLTGVVNELVGA